MTNATVAETGPRAPTAKKHLVKYKDGAKESRGAAGYADRHLRRWRQVPK